MGPIRITGPIVIGESQMESQRETQCLGKVCGEEVEGRKEMKCLQNQ